MKKVILLIVTCVLFSSSFAFAKSDKAPASEKLNIATKDLVSCHVEFAKASIDRKCEKLKKKIRQFEEQLRDYETYSNEASPFQIDSSKINKQKIKLIERIQQAEDRIYKLKLLKSSTEIVDFTNLN